MNDRASVRTMLIGQGLNGRYPQPDECLAFALSLPFKGHEALVHATPLVSADGVTLMGQTVRRRQWQIERRRFCPACLAEDAYHRTWWDLPDFRRCPHHDVDLVDRDGNDRRVPWWSPSFERSPSGVALAHHGVPRRAHPTPSPESYILGRLGAVDPVEVTLLDDLGTLGEALDAIRVLGRVASWGKDPSRPAHDDDGSRKAADVMRAGYAVARRGEAAVLALLHGVADARTGARTGGAKTSCFGWIPEELRRDERGSHTDMFERFLDRVVMERCRLPAAGEAEPRHDHGGWIPLPHLARELGMPVARLRRVSRALGIHVDAGKHTRNRFLTVLAAEAELIRRTVTTLVDREAVASLLGVRRSLVDGFVANGLLQAFAGIGEWRQKQHFRPEDVQAFAARVLAASAPVPTVPDGLVRLGTLERTHRRDPSRVVAGMLAGDLASIPRMGPGLADLLLPVRAGSGRPDPARPRTKAPRRKADLSRYEAATLIGCQIRMLDALLTAGLIVPSNDGHRRATRDSVDAFRKIWAPAEIYRDALGQKASDRSTGRRLEELGVSVRRLALKDGHTAFLVERASARIVLGLRHEPDAPESGSIRAFEAVLLAVLVERGTFRRSGQSGRLALLSPAADLGLHLAIRRRNETVVLELLRYSAVGVGLDEQVRHARQAPGGEIDVREVGTKLVATLRVPVPGLADPTTWPDLAERVAVGTDLFRTAFPPRRGSPAETDRVADPKEVVADPSPSGGEGHRRSTRRIGSPPNRIGSCPGRSAKVSSSSATGPITRQKKA